MAWRCHVRGFYLSIARALAVRMSIYQYLRALIEVPNRLENRLFLVNVTLPSCAQRKKKSCIPTRPREKSRGYAGGLMR